MERNKETFFLVETKYGLLKVINSILGESFMENAKNVYYINSIVSTNYLKKILKEDKNSLIIFGPECNWVNAK